MICPFLPLPLNRAEVSARYSWVHHVRARGGEVRGTSTPSANCLLPPCRASSVGLVSAEVSIHMEAWRRHMDASRELPKGDVSILSDAAGTRRSNRARSSPRPPAVTADTKRSGAHPPPPSGRFRRRHLQFHRIGAASLHIHSARRPMCLFHATPCPASPPPPLVPRPRAGTMTR